MSIRTRLLLLVIAVWLPSAAGFALLARATYQREAAAARLNVQQLARNLSTVVERELDKRVVMATTLAASRALFEDDIERFHEESAAAARGSEGWVVLVDGESVLANTRVERPARMPRSPGAVLLSAGAQPVVSFNASGPLVQRPVLGVLAPERHSPVRYNVLVAFDPSVIQAVLGQFAYPPGMLAAVIDSQQRVMARNRDPEKWLGRSATGPMRQRAAGSESGFAETVTLDGVHSLSYLTRPNRYGWSTVIALPLASLQQAARRVTLQAVAGSGLLLLIGLGLAWYAAGLISRPVLALRGAATRLGQGEAPPLLSTGLAEADEVSAALHGAGQRAQEAARLLEHRVAQAVAQAEQAQLQLVEGQKHEAIGRLTAGLAHDFNNLLQTISMGLQVLERTRPAAPADRALQGAMRACSRAADLVRQLLAFGRKEALRPEPIALDDFLLRSRELTGKAVGARITLSAEVAPGLPALVADPTQLELALLNLVFNARDAMVDGGQIRITGRLAGPQESGSLAGGPFVCIEVADNGPGMDEETRLNAFEPYFTTKPAGAGTGLGLPQVKAFARQSGGDVLLDSRPGEGTRIRLLLPASELPAQPVAPQGNDGGALSPLTILMVEDDLLVASVVSQALQAQGHQVTVCGDADAAVARLTAGERFDVVFTDVVMPGSMTGLDLAAWCRSHRPGLPTVVTTGYTNQLAEPDLQLLAKPYTIESLLAALGRAVQTPPAGS